MKKTYKIIYFLIFITALLMMNSCSRKAQEAVPVVLDTMITFVSGEAYVADKDGGRHEAEIGEKLFPDYSLTTMSDSYLEFRIGKSGVIRMDADTHLELSDFTQKTEKDYTASDITLSLAAGTVVQKVKKITGNESYHVKTASAAFGVRGTEFLVSTIDGNDTLAVGSGSVIASLFPEEIEKLKEKADSGDEDYIEIYKTLEESFPVLEAGEEISVKKADIKSAAEYLKDVNKLIEKAEAGEISKENAVLSIKTNIEAAAETAVKLASVPVSEKNSSALKHAQKFIPDEEKPDTELYIKTEPSDAAVYFDGNLAGYGSLKALFSGEKIINLRVEKDGYYPFEKEIRTGEIKESPYVITLEKKAGAVSVKAYPADSNITVEGVGSFTGKYSGQFDPGTSISVSVSRDEYITEKAVYLIEENTSIDEKIVLKPMLIPFQFNSGIGSSDIIIRVDDDNMLSAGNESGFSFFSKKGEKKWSLALSYAERPVITGKSLVFVSGSSLERADFESGSVSASVVLKSSLYQEPEYFDGMIFINSGNDVLKINPDSFEKEKTYSLPDAVVSNPYYYRGKLYSVTDKGVLHIYGENKVADSAVSVARGNPEGVDITASEDTAYFAGLKGELFAMNIETADFVWDGAFESEGVLPSISMENDKIILESGKLLSFYTKDGELLFSADSAVDTWSFTEEGEFAYVTGGNTVVVCSSIDGSVLKRGKIEEGIRDITVVNGRIYAVKQDGTVLAVNTNAF